MQLSIANEQTTGSYASSVIAIEVTPLPKPKILNISKDSQLNVETGTPNKLHCEKSLASLGFHTKAS
eukprot:1143335-Karenia_brevis.AAC.1